MYLQSFENNGSQPEQYYRYNPEIHGGKEILEKPFLLINSTSITVYNIHQRIQLQNRDPIAWQGIQIPQNRSGPHADLQSDTDDLRQIPEKYYYCTSRIAECQYKNEQAEAIVYDLYRIYGRIIPVNCCHNQQQTHKKYMNKGGCNNLDDRQDTDLKYYFFHQIVIFQQRIGSIV